LQSYFECVELGVGEPIRRGSGQSQQRNIPSINSRQDGVHGDLGQQLISGQGYVIHNNPQSRPSYVANAQARSTQQAQRRSSNPNRNHEPIDQFSRRQRANPPQRRSNPHNRRKASGANRYRVSPSTSAGVSGNQDAGSDTQRLLPDPQRAGSSREAMAVLAQFVQGVENRRSSGQLLSTHQPNSNPLS